MKIVMKRSGLIDGKLYRSGDVIGEMRGNQVVPEVGVTKGHIEARMLRGVCACVNEADLPQVTKSEQEKPVSKPKAASSKVYRSRDMKSD